MKIILVSLMLLFFGMLITGCENAPVRREEMMTQHPDWDSEFVLLIREGFIAKGMNQEQVKAAWGKPCWSCTGTKKGPWGEAWEYTTQVVFFGTDGKVVRWEAK